MRISWITTTTTTLLLGKYGQPVEGLKYASEGCSIPADGEIDELPGEENNLPKRQSSMGLKTSTLMKCVTMMDPNAPPTAKDEGPSTEANLAIQFMPDQDSKQYEVTHDPELSKGLMEGQGFSGPEVGIDVDGEINMVVGNGTMVGSARSKGSVYLFVEMQNGESRVTELNITNLPREMDPEEKPWDPAGRKLRSLSLDHNRLLQKRPEPAITKPFIDILVPYTRRTACNIVYGYSTASCRLDAKGYEMVKSFVELNIYESNVAFQNSGIDGRFRLAKTFLIDETYDELGKSFPTMLSQLALKGDNILEDVHTNRDKYGGDLVLMLVDNTESCGLAYTGYPVAQQWAMSVVYWQCATGYYSFAHELAHTMGANHDRKAEGCAPGTCCKKGCSNFGYQDPRGQFRTIMAYDCPIYGGCPRIQMFSQPYYSYYQGSRGVMTGDTYNNNALQIKSSWDIVSGYRGENADTEEVDYSRPPDMVLNRLDPCGNDICEPELGEDCFSCSKDCIGGLYKGAFCGDGMCSANEDCVNCPEDCASRLNARKGLNFCCVGGIPGRDRSKRNMGDGPLEYAVGCRHSFCRFNTSCDTRNKNAIPAFLEDRKQPYCCGNGKCEAGEGTQSCPTDCWGKTHPTLPTSCMADGRVCAKMTPDPCCGSCNTKTRRCEGAPTK